MKRYLLYIIITVILISTLAQTRIISAELFKYTEDNGTIDITNDSDKIPDKYKDRVQVLTDDKDINPNQTEPLKHTTKSSISSSLTSLIYSIINGSKVKPQEAPSIINKREETTNREQLKDINNIIGQDMNKTILLIGFSFIGSIISIFIVRLLIPRQPMRTIVTIIIILIINLISFSSFIGPTLQKGSIMTKDISNITKDKINNLTEQRPLDIDTNSQLKK
jgi:hypothetical protein